MRRNLAAVLNWGLRDYGTATWEGGDPDCAHAVRPSVKVASSTLTGGQATNGHQREGYRDQCGRCGARRVDLGIGLEATPEEHIARLVEVFREVRRVLRKDGTLWLNYGDAYAANRSYQVTDNKHRDVGNNRAMEVPQGLKPKDLIGLPWRLAFALQADGWWLRSEITWCKKAAMPESVRDRPTNATEKVFLLAKSASYYYDAEAVKEAASVGWNGSSFTSAYDEATKPGLGRAPRIEQPTRNMRNYWLLGPEPLDEPHYAAFPTEIPRRAILAGTSEAGACPACGAPWERLVERVGETARQKLAVKGPAMYAQAQPRKAQGLDYAGGHGCNLRETQTLGWRPTCSCDASEPVPCLVLDPFAGAFTTGVVARQLGRAFIGIELNPVYVAMGLRRMERVTPALPGLAAPVAPAPRAAQLALEAEA